MGSRDGRNSADETALRLVQEHAAELLRFARRFSHCADDAHDAYQRSLEILVRRLRIDPPEQPLSWLRTVLRHEALAVRAERNQLVGRTEIDLDRHEDRHAEDPADHAVGHERLRQTAEALRRLKPQEVTALVLRAEGLTYREICTRTGWTYTRTNRSITEGRRALLARLGAIESGAECARWLPLLSALADGEATAMELAELRPHLRSCSACRATLRDFHAAPAQVAELVPPVLLPLAAAADGSVLGHIEIALHGLAERATLLGLRLQGTFEALPGTKLAAVAASTAALAGGGVALERATDRPRVADVAAQVVGAPAAPASAQLLSTGASFRAPRAAGRERRPRAGESDAEFGTKPTAPPEFTFEAPPEPEFASASPAPHDVPTPTAPAAAASQPPPARATPPSTPSEFSGP